MIKYDDNNNNNNDNNNNSNGNDSNSNLRELAPLPTADVASRERSRVRVSHSRRGDSRHPGRRRGARGNPVFHSNWLQWVLRGRPFLGPSLHLPIAIRFFVLFRKSLFFLRFSGRARVSLTIRTSWRAGRPPRRSRRTPSRRPDLGSLCILHVCSYFCLFVFCCDL